MCVVLVVFAVVVIVAAAAVVVVDCPLRASRQNGVANMSPQCDGIWRRRVSQTLHRKLFCLRLLCVAVVVVAAAATGRVNCPL